MERVVLNPPQIAPPAGNYSHTVRVVIGDAVLVFVSGQAPIDAQGVVVAPGNMAQQSIQVYENVRLALEAHGARLKDVVRVGTFFVEGADRAAHTEVRTRYMPSPPPASTTVFVSALVGPEWLVEVEVMAVIHLDELEH